jgi:myo-inositol-1(or 4)-monophosphatase
MPGKEGFEMLAEVEDIVRRAGNLILFASDDKEVREKSSRRDLVTRYDSAVEQKLRGDLLALVPEAGFLGEEHAGEAGEGKELQFIVDPIDGTSNFIKGLPYCAISVALARRGEVELGVVCNPFSGELFAAERGRGATLNGKPIHAETCAVEDCVLGVGTTPYLREYADASFRIARGLYDRCLDLRRFGAAALELCSLAAGRLGGYFECVLWPWDYAAGSLIASEAGAVVTDLTGAPLRFDRRCSLAAGTPACHAAILEIAGRAEVPSP